VFQLHIFIPFSKVFLDLGVLFVYTVEFVLVVFLSFVLSREFIQL
jgi:hypothetical protein